MRNFFVTLLFCLFASAFFHNAHADPNTAPFNVGLYSYSAPTLTTTTNTVLVARNTARAGLFIQNQGSAAVVIKFGSVPANATDGIVLAAGAIYNPPQVPVDAIYGQASSTTQKVVFMEFIK